MTALWYIVVAIVVFVPAFLVARWVSVAKGRSFVGFLILGLLLSWIVSLIVALVVSDQRR